MKTWIWPFSIAVGILVGCGEGDATGVESAALSFENPPVSGLTSYPSHLNPIICQPSWQMSVSGFIRLNGQVVDMDGSIASASAKHSTTEQCDGRVGEVVVSIARRNGECYLWLTFRDRILADVVFDARGCGLDSEPTYLRAKRQTLTRVKGLPESVANPDGECLKARTLAFGSRPTGLSGPSGDAQLSLDGLKIRGDVWSAPDPTLTCPRSVSW